MKYIVSEGKVVDLEQGADGLMRDSFGCIYALPDATSIDQVVRCGVGPFSLSPEDPATAACGPHDYAYSSKTYQLFHTREEADLYLENLLEQVPCRGFLAKPFYCLARLFGGLFWENERTR